MVLDSNKMIIIPILNCQRLDDQSFIEKPIECQTVCISVIFTFLQDVVETLVCFCSAARIKIFFYILFVLMFLQII